MSRHRPGAGILLATICALALAGCSSAAAADGGEPSRVPGPSSAAGSAGPTTPTLSGDLTVFAAASLQSAFRQIGDDLMAANPRLRVTFNFGSSGTLSQQLLSGAPADVFASADTATMTHTAAVLGGSSVFAHNTLVIVVPRGNPAGVTGLTDFTRADLTLALCDPSAPCGSAAQAVFREAALTALPDTFGQDVKATLNLVAADEVDAAMVYKTDAIAADDAVEAITIPEASSVINDYPIAVVKNTKNPAAAQAFIDAVLSPAGQRVFIDAGFAGA